MSGLSAVAACVVLLAVGALQVQLAAGRPLGRFAWGGTREVLPSVWRVASAASVAVYALIGLILLDAGGVADVVPGEWSRSAVWVLAGFFSVGVAMNAASRSPSERRVMTPVAVTLCLLCVGVGLG